MEYTKNFSIPMLHQNQAKKEYTINEALVRMDSIAAKMVRSRTAQTPYNELASGDLYIVPQTSSEVLQNEWETQEGNVAIYINGKWEYIKAKRGLQFWVEDEDLEVRYDGEQWN